jgi:hypothetical protein
VRELLPALFLTYWLIDVVIIIIRQITNTVDIAAFNKFQKGEIQVGKYIIVSLLFSLYVYVRLP